MAALRVTFHDAAGAPLADRLNVTATNVRTNAGACRAARVDGSQTRSTSPSSRPLNRSAMNSPSTSGQT